MVNYLPLFTANPVVYIGRLSCVQGMYGLVVHKHFML